METFNFYVHELKISMLITDFLYTVRVDTGINQGLSLADGDFTRKAELGISHVIYGICTTSVPKNAKITWKILRSANGHLVILFIPTINNWARAY